MKPFTVIDAEQRTPEWKACRLGRLTGSRAADMLATIKTGEAAARRDYRMQLVCERLTGQPQEDGFVSNAMARGTEMEPAAFAAYEAMTGDVLVRTGFLAHNTWLAGCSLDGHVGDFDRIVELKCPKSSTHLSYLRSGGVIPSNHIAQLLHALWVTDATEADFMSFDDRFPSSLQVFHVRVSRVELAAQLVDYHERAMKFLAEVDAETAAVKRMVAA